MKRFASIDIGTQTIRLLVAEMSNKGTVTPLFRDRVIVRLGEGMNNKPMLNNAPMERAINCIKNFAMKAAGFGVDNIVGVATSCVREAANSYYFIDSVCQETGITIRIINGIEEAKLSLKGVRSVFFNNLQCSMVVDIGGGSTEFVLTDEDNTLFMESLPLGVVYLTEKHLLNDPPLSSEITLLKDDIFSILMQRGGSILKKITPQMRASLRIIGTAGTITTLAAMDLKLKEYDPDKINGHRLTRSAIEQLYNEMIEIPAQIRKNLPGLEPGRETVIVTGTVIVLAIMYLLEVKELMVSDAGLLEGILLDAAGVNA